MILQFFLQAQAQWAIKPQYLKTQYEQMGNLLHFFDTFEQQTKVKHVVYITDKQGFEFQASNCFDSIHDFVIPGLINAYSVANRVDPPYYKSQFRGKWNYILNHELSPEKNLGIGGYLTYTNQRDAKLIFEYVTPMPLGNYNLNILTEDVRNSFDILIIINGKTQYAVTASDIKNDIISIRINQSSVNSIEIRTKQNSSNQKSFTFHGLYLEPTDKAALIVHQIPIIGDVFNGMLKQSLFLRHMNFLNPKLLVIDPGNAHLKHGYTIYQTKSEINRVLGGLKNRSPNTTVICISPQETNRYSSPIYETALFNNDYKEICFKYNMAFIDWFAASGGRNSGAAWKSEDYLQANGFCLNQQGCKRKEEYLSSAFKDAYDNIVILKNLSNIIPDYNASGIKIAKGGEDKDFEDDKPKRILHQVGKGQNLYRISLAYDVSQEDIIKWNDLPNDQLQTGQLITIYKDNKRKDLPSIPKVDQDHKSKKRIFHKVKAGQTLFSIARKYDTDPEAIKRLNKLKTSSIVIGQLLRVK